MRAVLALIALCVAGCAGGRLYTSRSLHVGVRPAVDCTGGADGCGAAVTLQVSTSALP